MNHIKPKGTNLHSKQTLLLTILLSFCPIVILTSQTLNIKNDRFWDTKSGEPIYSQGGGIFKFVDSNTNLEKYYWYGVHYKEAELYRNDPSITQPHANFVSVTCYTSTDLVNWESEKPVLTKEEVDQNFSRTGWMGRLGVAYISELKKYAMFIQHNNEVLITVSDSPTGPFKWHQRISMESMIGTSNTGDQTVFTDEDTGISYLVYSYGKGRHKIYISEIGVKDGMVNLLDCTQVFKGAGREGNCMFKYKGKYYLFASNLYGWDSSYAYYLVADDIRGPYLPENKMLITPGSMDDYAHVTQTGFFTTLKTNNQELVIYCGDRWANFAGNGLGYNQWCPITFEADVPYFNSLHSWNFDISTGNWDVAADNNYVKNGSFEADRRHVPSPVKPIQEQLKGWFTKIYEGNVIVVGSDESPVLNYFNTEEDRKHVIGEKSLNISDVIKFKRKIYQTIESSPFVKLEEGSYKLSAKIKNTNGFSKLNMYAESGGQIKFLNVIEQNTSWTPIEIDDIYVSNGKVDIGFMVEGIANAACQIDDVAFVKSTK
ncbi:Glycosyl hydrolases family 43 [Mariniflexile rhizosphaerae]|uniref:family 43 glycosylhydrolase n=1 Tax=unclassified Mariniflexile TaxID=2643887 RepID=UPI000E337111|nr:family 43 glycosylhydrolase [Mariniflexile sp. TRM1-10]AXP80146.1 Glycosyl hydrolases family 43 [Mariniflexile sp. TRM1-10]